MNLIDMKAADIVLLFEITLTDLRKLKLALDNAELNLDLSKERERDADVYIHEVFYPVIENTIKETEKHA